jgi:hypothetical protein
VQPATGSLILAGFCVYGFVEEEGEWFLQKMSGD